MEIHFNRKKILIFLGSIIVLLVILFLLFLSSSKQEEVVDKNIKYKDAQSIYQKLNQNCQGALVWNIKKYQSLNLTYEEARNNCQKNYVSRLYAFTSNDEEVILDVKILELDNEKLYDLDKNFVDDYNINNLNDSLEKGSMYRYSFKNSTNYPLNYVERVS